MQMEVYGQQDGTQMDNLEKTTVDSVLPQQMIDAKGNIIYGIKEVAAGAYHTLAIKEDNTVWGTGYNNYGQVGDGTKKEQYVLTQMKEQDGTIIKDAKHITTSSYSTITPNSSKAIPTKENNENVFSEIYLCC